MIEHFLNAHELSAPLLLVLLFLLALTESLALVGLLIPGIAGLVALTVVAAAMPVSPLWWWLAGACGALCGDGISFHLGRFSSHRLHHWRMFRQHPDWLSRGHEFFMRYGLLSIAVGRFIGPLRPLIPLVAGACEMSPVTFWWVNLISSAAWSAVYLLPVYWLGQGALTLLPGWLLVLLLLLVSALALLLSRWLARRHS